MYEDDWQNQEESDVDSDEQVEEETDDEDQDEDNGDIRNEWIYCYPESDFCIPNVTWIWECYQQDAWTPYSVCEQRKLEEVC